MTDYATHRFSVGQQVTRSGETPTPCAVIAQIDGPDGPEYRIKSGRSETVVGERELTYSTGPASAARPASAGSLM
jgi:hypothetical protein